MTSIGSFIDEDSGDVAYEIVREDGGSFSLSSGDCKKRVEFVSQFEIGAGDLISDDMGDMDQDDTHFGEKFKDSFSKFPLGLPRILSNGKKKNSILPLFFVKAKSHQDANDNTVWKLTVFLPHSFGRKNSSGISFVSKKKPKVTLACSDRTVRIKARSSIDYDNGRNTWGTFEVSFSQNRISNEPIVFTYKLIQDEGYAAEPDTPAPINLDEGICNRMRLMINDEASFDFTLLGSGGANVGVHKLALLLFDPQYFSICFHSNMKESVENALKFEDFNQADLEVLKGFIYAKPILDYYSLELLRFSFRVGTNKAVQDHFVDICCDQNLEAPIIDHTNVFYYKREFPDCAQIQRTCEKVMETLKTADIHTLAPQDALEFCLFMKGKYCPDAEEPPKKKMKLYSEAEEFPVIVLDSPTHYAGIPVPSLPFAGLEH